MKTFKVLLVSFISLANVSIAQASAADVSVHGMFVFGKEKIYLNHLAMFMAPHDEQAICEATFDSEGKEAYEKATSGLVTLVPQPMSLIQLINKPHDFYGDLYDGHFERGGKKIATHILIHISKVIHAHSLENATEQSDIQFDNCSAHYIAKEPDFDEINCDKKVIYHEEEDLR